MGWVGGWVPAEGLRHRHRSPPPKARSEWHRLQHDPQTAETSCALPEQRVSLLCAQHMTFCWVW